ncbi:aldo/keto reductase [Gonapodya prolifera JEL478]|uniref:Aldo/keto reductase n=1 Tax=Gonapodya prolifera (strain JEL478) TaxID=1344416 RepID=A0A139B089_GONPJ|nr:aldo/keto reductase [Gonapodya prolifera JEL478]|eukprot:KXS22412.1 aldo/keto reductase [Gonapodya prolifera JEL478]
MTFTSVPKRQVILDGKSYSLSSIGLGCMSFSLPAMQGQDPATIETAALEVIGKSLEMGVNIVNTATFYGPDGHNEKLLAKAIAKFGREKFFITDKFGVLHNRTTNAFEFSAPDSVAEECDASLKRLGTDYIDVYIPARVNPEVPIEKTMEQLAALQAAGKIRHIGLSEANAATIRRAHKIAPISFLEIEYSLWETQIEQVVLPCCRELGIKILAYSPLGRGFLTGTVKREDLGERDFRKMTPRFQGENFDNNKSTFLTPIEDIANRMSTESGEAVKPSQVALAWVLSRGEDIFPIPGTKRVQLLEENLKAAAIKLSSGDLTTLDTVVREGAAVGGRYPEFAAHMLQDLTVDSKAN